MVSVPSSERTHRRQNYAARHRPTRPRSLGGGVRRVLRRFQRRRPRRRLKVRARVSRVVRDPLAQTSRIVSNLSPRGDAHVPRRSPRRLYESPPPTAPTRRRSNARRARRRRPRRPRPRRRPRPLSLVTRTHNSRNRALGRPRLPRCRFLAFFAFNRRRRRRGSIVREVSRVTRPRVRLPHADAGARAPTTQSLRAFSRALRRASEPPRARHRLETTQPHG